MVQVFKSRQVNNYSIALIDHQQLNGKLVDIINYLLGCHYPADH